MNSFTHQGGKKERGTDGNLDSISGVEEHLHWHTHNNAGQKCALLEVTRGGKQRRGGTLLLLAAIKTKRELVKRMDENSAQINTEITHEMKNCTLFDKDRQLLTLFVHKTKESLKTTLRQM